MAVEPTKICKYSLADLKNTSDDAIAPYMKSLGFKQSNILTDVRLALGFTACTIAGITFYLDWTQGFEKTKHVTLFTVIAYFILNSALTLWIWFVEAGQIYVGEKDGVKVSITTRTEKYDHNYYLTIKETYPGETKVHETKVKTSFTNWFDETGLFVKKPFNTFLNSSIPTVAAKTGAAELVAGLKDKSHEKSRS